MAQSKDTEPTAENQPDLADFQKITIGVDPCDVRYETVVVVGIDANGEFWVLDYKVRKAP